MSPDPAGVEPDEVELGLFALTYALIEANSHGWTSARIVGAFAVAVMTARCLQIWTTYA